MNYMCMLNLIKVELNKQTEEIKQYIKDEYDRGYHAGFSDGYDEYRAIIEQANKEKQQAATNTYDPLMDREYNI